MSPEASPQEIMILMVRPIRSLGSPRISSERRRHEIQIVEGNDLEVSEADLAEARHEGLRVSNEHHRQTIRPHVLARDTLNVVGSDRLHPLPVGGNLLDWELVK